MPENPLSSPIRRPESEEIREQLFHALKRWRARIGKFLSDSRGGRRGAGALDALGQNFLDRLIFLDYCADNRILWRVRLHARLSGKTGLHGELKRMFSGLEETFGSNPFAADPWDRLVIDDEIIEPIVKELAGIDFTKLTVHVLGEVYEEYLGELLRTHRRGTKAAGTSESSKRKSQGIYYTPVYIVDYMVGNTLGKTLRKCRTLADVERIRVLDPACGAGSFLIRVFDEFLEHYERVKPPGMPHVEIRKRILEKNIFGVDLDERAVGIAKRILLIKALAGIARASLAEHDSYPKSDRESDGKPDLETQPGFKLNIRAGNSLISNREIPEAFDYRVSFPEAFEDGGFDCVIGNPPYIDSEIMAKEQPGNRALISGMYSTARGNWDIYIPFFEKAYELTKANGSIGLITPNKWLTAPYASALRNFLKDKLGEVTDCANIRVFKAGNNPLIAFLAKEASEKKGAPEMKVAPDNKVGRDEKKRADKRETPDKKEAPGKWVVKKRFGPEAGIHAARQWDRRALEARSWGFLLAEHPDIIGTLSKNRAATVKEVCTIENPCSVAEAYGLIGLLEDGRKQSGNHFRFVNTGTLDPFVSLWGEKPAAYIKRKYPHPVLNRAKFMALFPRRFRQSATPKLITTGMRHFECFHDREGGYTAGKSTVILHTPKTLPLDILSAILNSRIVSFYLMQLYQSAGIDGGINFTPAIIGDIPIPEISGELGKSVSERVAEIVALSAARDERLRNRIRIHSLKKDVDQALYRAFGLSAEEMERVEAFPMGKGGRP